MKPLRDGSAAPLVTRHDGALLDLDGVLYTGSRAVPGAAQAVAQARRAGVRVAFVTNNASRTPKAVADHLTDLGIPAAPVHVVSSAQAAATVLAKLVGPAATVLVVGGEGLVQALTERGLRPVRSLAEGPDAVVQGWSPDVGWRQLAEGTYAVRSGLPWVATNLDVTVPTADGIAPGNGTLVEVVAMATGRRPLAVGKPEPALHAEALRRSGIQDPVVVGDRLDTDIEGANRAGAPGLLVLTGVTTPLDLLLAPAHRRPTYVSADLDGLHVPHPRVTPDGAGGWGCAGSVSRVRDGRVEVAGDGDALDGLRAACVAVWEHTDAGGVIGTDVLEDVVARLGLASTAVGAGTRTAVG